MTLLLLLQQLLQQPSHLALLFPLTVSSLSVKFLSFSFFYALLARYRVDL